jgi:hypothetical protein
MTAEEMNCLVIQYFDESFKNNNFCICSKSLLTEEGCCFLSAPCSMCHYYICDKDRALKFFFIQKNREKLEKYHYDVIRNILDRVDKKTMFSHSREEYFEMREYLSKMEVEELVRLLIKRAV